MYKIPKFWKKFKAQMTAGDIYFGRKVILGDRITIVVKPAERKLLTPTPNRVSLDNP